MALTFQVMARTSLPIMPISWTNRSPGSTVGTAFKFGGENRPGQFNIRVLTGTSGQFNFNSGPTSIPSDTNSGFGYASFFLGTASNAFIALPEKLGWRSKYLAAFVTDDWKISRKLTANLGLRYDITLPTVEAHDQLSYLDPTLPNPGAGGLPGAYAFAGKGAGRTGQRTTPQSTFLKGVWSAGWLRLPGAARAP